MADRSFPSQTSLEGLQKCSITPGNWNHHSGTAFLSGHSCDLPALCWLSAATTPPPAYYALTLISHSLGLHWNCWAFSHSSLSPKINSIHIWDLWSFSFTIPHLLCVTEWVAQVDGWDIFKIPGRNSHVWKLRNVVNVPKRDLHQVARERHSFLLITQSIKEIDVHHYLNIGHYFLENFLKTLTRNLAFDF